MKRMKSSLGRRSSSMGGVRNSDMNMSSRPSVKKKSLLLQPGFARNSRSNSVDAIDDIGKGGGVSNTPQYSVNSSGNKMQRSRSQMNLNVITSTPKNLSFATQPGLPLGSTRSVRSRSSVGDSKMSGFGSLGGKLTKKDIRPVTEKGFIQQMTEKVQKLAAMHPEIKQLMTNGKIRPMSTALFIALSELVLRYFDPLLPITVSNYAAEIPNIAKTFMYKGKLDRTMLITVNTPHTYPHVIAFLGWFAECQEMARALDIGLLFQKFDDGFGEPDDEEEDDMDFEHILPFLSKSIAYERKGKKLDALFADLVQKYIAPYKDEFIFENASECNELEERYLAVEATLKLDEFRAFEDALSHLRRDDHEQEVYLTQSIEYNNNINNQLEMVDQESSNLESKVESLSKEIEMLRLAVQNQTLSIEDKERLMQESRDISREMGLLEAQTKSFNEILYAEQMELAKARNKVDSNILQYNTELFEDNLPNILQELKLDSALLSQGVLDEYKRVNDRLTELIDEVKKQEEDVKTELIEMETAVNEKQIQNNDIVKQYEEINAENIKTANRMKEMRQSHQIELETLENAIKSIDIELDSIAQKKPDMIETQKEYNRVKQEMISLADKMKADFDKMKKKIIQKDRDLAEIHAYYMSVKKKMEEKHKEINDLISEAAGVQHKKSTNQ